LPGCLLLAIELTLMVSDQAFYVSTYLALWPANPAF